MKQTITKEQWDELTLKEKKKLVAKLYGNLQYYKDDDAPILYIGNLIEFLGEGWEDKIFTMYGWCTCRDGIKCNAKIRQFEEGPKELIDALWTATKYKLKN